MNGHIELSNVDISQFANLNYNKATIDQTYLSRYLAAGHNENQIVLYNYFEPNPMPQVVDEIKQHFSFLSPLSIAVNYCQPGQYLPLHSDLYKKWAEVFNVKEVGDIKRYIVMLEDHVPGQMLAVGNDVYTEWQSGDYFGWQGVTQHAIYNLSLKDRYAVQVTGIV
jgi:hypothetical protein